MSEWDIEEEITNRNLNIQYSLILWLTIYMNISIFFLVQFQLWK